MATFPNFHFPSQSVRANSAFAPAAVDFSRIGQIADSYYNAQDAATQRRNAAEDRAFQTQRRDQAMKIAQQGAPRDAQGNFDPTAAAARLWELGDFDKAAGLVANQTPKLTDDQREYAAARQQGYQGSFMDYLKQVKSFGAAQTNIDMKQETSYDKKLGEELANEFVNANRAAATAQQDIASLNTMKQALADPNLYTGTGGNVVQAVKKGAETLFGVPVKGTSSGEIMQNLANEIAVGNREKLPGPMSNADREFLVEMAPGLSKTPEGNRLLIELGLEHKQWQVERAKSAREYASQNGGRLDGGYYAFVGNLDNQYDEKFKTILAGLRGLGTAAPRAPTTGTPLDAYKSKYGLE